MPWFTSIAGQQLKLCKLARPCLLIGVSCTFFEKGPKFCKFIARQVWWEAPASDQCLFCKNTQINNNLVKSITHTKKYILHPTLLLNLHKISTVCTCFSFEQQCILYRLFQSSFIHNAELPGDDCFLKLLLKHKH